MSREQLRGDLLEQAGSAAGRQRRIGPGMRMILPATAAPVKFAPQLLTITDTAALVAASPWSSSRRARRLRPRALGGHQRRRSR